MSSRKKSRLTKGLAFRLTLMYAGMCVVLLTAVLTISYLFLQSNLRRKLDEGLLNELDEYHALLKTQSMEVLRDVLEREAVSEGTDRVFFRVLDAAGKAIVATDMSAWPDVAILRSDLAAAAQGRTVFQTYRHEDRAHAARIAYGRIGPDLILQLGESTVGNAEVLEHFRRVFAAAIIALALCSILAGGFMARRALSGVQQVTRTARAIASGTWNSRVPLSQHHDEIDELALAFNEMVERIQVLIGELREVTDDIAHDLRTPIMRIRGAAETALRASEVSPDQEEMAGSILEECDRLLGLINITLEISQTEAGAKPLAVERVDLSAIAKDVWELFRSSAEDKSVTSDFRTRSGLVVNGDAQKLKRAIAHIVDNAVKYTDPGGNISVVCDRNGDMAIVSIRDTGVGIPERDLDKVFARFYRVDQSRSRSGNGLGLSLSRAICRAHGGDIAVTSVLGKGSTFEITIPATAT